VIAVDTNLLVYAHRQDSSWHRPASDRLRELAEGHAPWALPWPSLHEFVAIVSHPRIYAPPSTIRAAVDQVDAWLESPSVQLLAEGPTYWGELRTTLLRGGVLGPLVHDARIATLCASHGVRELWTADRDFSRFPELTIRNPLVG
jgi:toxin-antitoxin system PIN domain toxin